MARAFTSLEEFKKFLREVERKWQREWEKHRIFEADPDPSKPKFFITVAFPYVNSPQHIGHARTYSIADVYARFKRMQGYNVLFPMGWHYTGTPIVAMSRRIARGDKELIDLFIRIYGVPPEVVKEFVDPLKLAEYFKEEIKEGMKLLGYSIDWRREFRSIDPDFSRFIWWQFEKLREKGYITRGTHPIPYCPSSGNPASQHDTIGDVEPEVGEFILIKFVDDEGVVYPAATLRPETVFGVTNMWVNPDATYVIAKVGSETWVVSKRCAEKLPYQLKKVKVVRELKGRELVGKYVKNPATGEKVPILPAKFVDPNVATGVVMSVPAHAPYDYVALKEVKERPEEFGVSPELVKGLEPKKIIEVEGIEEPTAKVFVEKYGITSQTDERLKEVTKEVYSLELRKGVMASNTGKYAGMSVQEAREAVREDLAAAGKADIMYEIMNGPVYCRDGDEVIVCILPDQWFIDYSKPEWKKLAYEALESMRIIPEEVRNEFRDVIEWVKMRACARKVGLGTPLPWDKDWIIESLSDSTIYMAFYTIVHKIRRYGIKPEQLKPEFFDYVFLGKGDPEKVAESCGVSKEILEDLRNEFMYWYPLDSRHSGRDLVWNHLTFFIFNHVAIFPRELWPRQIVVNGFVLMEGKKMSKSLGNIIPVRKAVDMFGADVIRLATVSTAELLQDVDFSAKLAETLLRRLMEIYNIVARVADAEEGDGELTRYDRWILSRVAEVAREAEEALENVRTREAAQKIFFELFNDVQEYMQQEFSKRPVTAKVMKKVVDAWIRMIAPFTPHIAEEMWRVIGKETFVSLEKWPKFSDSEVDYESLLWHEYRELIERDVQEILQVLKKSPNKIYLYTADPRLYKVLRYVVAELEKGRTVKELIGEVIKKFRGEVPGIEKIAKKLIDHATNLPFKVRKYVMKIEELDELPLVTDMVKHLSSKFGAEVKVYSAVDPNRYDPKNRAKLALPLKPAIYVE